MLTLTQEQKQRVAMSFTDILAGQASSFSVVFIEKEDLPVNVKLINFIGNELPADIAEVISMDLGYDVPKRLRLALETELTIHGMDGATAERSAAMSELKCSFKAIGGKGFCHYTKDSTEAVEDITDWRFVWGVIQDQDMKDRIIDAMNQQVTTAVVGNLMQL